MTLPPLRVYAPSANVLGDTFTRLATDLFQTLGYDECRINIHKTGRELDIKGRHAFENKILVAECKAHKEPIGGADINKFVGVVDAEQRRAGKNQVAGYYLSLSGYTESALEQEEELGNSRVVLLDATEVVKRIGASGIVVTQDQAAHIAGRFISETAPTLNFHGLELIAHHRLGWLWAAFFADEARHKYACYIYADGQLASQNDHNDLTIDGADFLGAPAQSDSSRGTAAAQAYKNYLIREYGAITLEGMPADQEVGSKPFRLEDLYVPLQLEAITFSDNRSVDPGTDLVEGSNNDAVPRIRSNRLAIGQILENVNHVSMLGPPGSGKSTLIKRLVVAYCDDKRRMELADHLPAQNWVPIAIRCRDLGAAAGQSIYEVMRSAFLRSEEPDLADDFAQYLRTKLRVGEVLLLVDGLDEIPVARARASFVSQLRTFLARYPSIKVVMTSREVGFRHVASAVYSMCSAYRVAELTDDEIRILVKAWYREVVGIGKETDKTALDLGFAITSNDRVRRLATNPLLLTTLLLVQRWIGQLPRRRTVLYQKAIDVLLMTWNVEGHEPIDTEEALPQLCYAAHAMMTARKTQVSAAELAKLFQEAREEMPELLAYSEVSVATFLSRVEERSSLLVLNGYQLVDGNLIPMYEFKHLTFQEYLAAQALASRWLPKAAQDSSLADLLTPVLEESVWSEVVRMTAVLAGRIDGARIVERLIELTDCHAV